MLNAATSGEFQVSTWSRVGGPSSINVKGTGAAINGSGDVVGAGDVSGSDVQAFLWQSTAPVQWLGSLGGNLSAATGINSAGTVVGMSYTSANMQHAFLWTMAGGMQDLTPGLTSIGGSSAMGINSGNEVVGYYFPNGSRNTMGFTWTQAGGLENLGAAGTLVFAVNDWGTVVGETPVANGSKHAFSWTQTGGMVDLGALGGSGSSALSINSKGLIVGTFLPKGNALAHGFLWTPLGGMQDLSVLAHLSKSEQVSSAHINDSGVVAIATNKGGYILVPKLTATSKSSANPAEVGQPVTFTATFMSITGTPPDGETVQFVIGGKVLGTVALTSGVAEFTTSALSVGGHSVVASYPGDANFLPAKSHTLKQVVSK